MRDDIDLNQMRLALQRTLLIGRYHAKRMQGQRNERMRAFERRRLLIMIGAGTVLVVSIAIVGMLAR